MYRIGFPGRLSDLRTWAVRTIVARLTRSADVGELTIHGVTREIVLHAEVQGTDVDPWGNERVGLEVTGQLSRGDYGMQFNQMLGSGNMLVGDKVNLALDISAVKQSS